MSEELHSSVMALVSTLSGAAESALPLLEQLCIASEENWEARLRSGITTTDCQDAFICAAAFSALAAFRISQEPEVSSFAAGSVSIGLRSASETAAVAASLRRQAEQLMAAWVTPSDFAFKGVRT